MSTTTAEVTVYTRAGCVACMATFRALTKADIGYEAIDVTTNRPLEDELRALGALRMPVVVLADGTWWDGYRDQQIRDLRDRLTHPGTTTPASTSRRTS